MAQEMLDRETKVQETKFYEGLRSITDSIAYDANTVSNYISSNESKMSYTDADVIARASTLYDFVNKKI